MKTFTKLSQANVDHYNNHPAEHEAITLALILGGAVAIHLTCRRIAKRGIIPQGRFAK